MPARITFMLLIGFWFATIMWHVWVVELPIWNAGAPPASAMALSDETTAGSAPMAYSAWFNNEKSLTGRQSLEFLPEIDGFSLRFELASGGKKMPGRLVKLDAGVTLERSGAPVACNVEVDQGVAVTSFSFERNGRQVLGEYAVEARGMPGFSGRVPVRPAPWNVVPGRPVLCPFIPAWRYPDLVPGQTWLATIIDPVGDLMRPGEHGLTGSTIKCRVANELEKPPRTRKQPECHRVDAVGAELSVSAWVLPRTGRIVAQRVRFGPDETWEFVIEELP